MKQTKLWMLAALLTCGSMGAQAQESTNAENTANGKAVRRIVFDREQVTLVYADGSTEEGVQRVAIRRTNGTNGVASLSLGKSGGDVYNLSGQKVASGKSNGQLPKGVYIKREGNRVRKTVKK